MPPQYRLSRSDFAHTRGFKRLHGALFSISYGEIPGRNAPGGACIVSTKVARSAVTRNRIKRQARPALLALLRRVSRPVVVLCIAKKWAEAAKTAEIQAEISDLSTKLR